ncbi:Uu.00g138720.m01.CDS01 [Anthostomella pinea]|uniref:Uu.00g138720.m01.CDS01 n=1 Tax=Anthostomella pinea TaxID=933095 RepID=A0AAI8VPQ1_9PEZI|nr:Uu.00g138720.m01.CDS01 [Anthostomella pinea]
MPLRLGILVPSSNTALEPLTTAILSPLAPEVTVHFSRFFVTKISLEASALSQFDTQGPILAAARLLADARVDVIGWSGTSGGWLGFDADERLCGTITDAFGVPATTSTLALNRALDLLGVKKFALVTPYVDDVQARIVEVYAGAGYEVVAESHLRVSDNVTIAEISEETLDGQVKEVMEKGRGEVQAISTFCTNLKAAQRAWAWEIAKHQHRKVMTIDPSTRNDLVPWLLVISTKNFVTFLGSYLCFVSPIVTAMMVDYRIVRRGNFHIPSRYRPEPSSPYYYTKGVNFRAYAAWPLVSSLFPPKLYPDGEHAHESKSWESMVAMEDFFLDDDPVPAYIKDRTLLSEEPIMVQNVSTQKS